MVSAAYAPPFNGTIPKYFLSVCRDRQKKIREANSRINATGALDQPSVTTENVVPSSFVEISPTT